MASNEPNFTSTFARPLIFAALAPAKKMAAASTPTVALVPHAQAFAVSAVGLALFVTNNELAIAAVRDPEEAQRALSLLGTVSPVGWHSAEVDRG